MVCTSGTGPVCLVDLVCFVYLVHLVYPVSLVQPNKQDKPNKPIKRDRLADCFSILLGDRCLEGAEYIGQLPGRLNLQ